MSKPPAYTNAFGLITEKDAAIAFTNEHGIAAEHAELIYIDVSHNYYYQPVSDLVMTGTLIDPDNGDDMKIIGVRFLENRD